MNLLLIGNIISLLFTAVNLVEKVSGGREAKCEQGPVSFADFLISKLIGLGSNSCSCVESVNGENKKEGINNEISLNSENKKSDLNTEKSQAVDTNNKNDITREDLLVLSDILKEVFGYYGTYVKEDSNITKDYVKQDLAEFQKLTKVDVDLKNTDAILNQEDFSQLKTNDVSLNKISQKVNINNDYKTEPEDRKELGSSKIEASHQESLSVNDILNIIIGEVKKLERSESPSYETSEIDGNVSVRKNTGNIGKVQNIYVENVAENSGTGIDKTESLSKNNLEDVVPNVIAINTKNDLGKSYTEKSYTKNQPNLNVSNINFDNEPKESSFIIDDKFLKNLSKREIHTKSNEKLNVDNKTSIGEVNNKGDTKVFSNNGDLSVDIDFRVKIEFRDIRAKSNEVKSSEIKPFDGDVDKVELSIDSRESVTKSNDIGDFNFQNHNRLTSENIKNFKNIENNVDNQVEFRGRIEGSGIDTGKNDMNEKKRETDNVDAMDRSSMNQQIFKQETKDAFGSKLTEIVKSSEIADNPGDVKPKTESVKIVTMKIEDAPIEKIKLQFNSETKDLKVVIVDRKSGNESNYYSNNDFVELKKNLEDLGFKRVDVYVANSYKEASSYSYGRGKREAFSRRGLKRSIGIGLSPISEGQERIINVPSYESSIDKLA